MKKRSVVLFIALLSLMVGFAQLGGNVLFGQQTVGSESVKSTGKATDSMDVPLYAPIRVINGVEMADVFIGIESGAVVSSLKKQGVVVNCEFDGFVTAQIPVELMSKVSHMPGVTDIEISRMMKLASDSTLSITRAGQVLNGSNCGLPQSYDGNGVVIGIIDNGFDYQHVAFKRSDDPTQSRIVRVYDPQDSTGHEARLGENVLPGSVFMGAQIDTLTHDYGSHSAHGTHVTGLAAGTHISGYGGMAPKAEIVMCVCRNLNVYLPETEVANCIKYIYSYADSVGKPCVISVSVSTAFGPHDGSDRLSQVIAQTTGPGHIFVIAAGNTGNRYAYAYGPSTMEKPLNMQLGFQTEGYYRNVMFDTWIRTLRVRPVVQYHIFDTSTKRIVWKSELITMYKKIDASQFSQYFEPDATVGQEGYLTALLSLTSAKKYEVQLTAYNLKSKAYNGDQTSRYKIGVTVYPPKISYPNQTDSIYIDSWVVQGSLGSYGGIVYTDDITESGDTVTIANEGYYRWPDDNCCIGTYAVHDSIISAGSYVARNSYYSWALESMQYDNIAIGSIYSASSYQVQGYGPTGKALPTVMAPGYNVVSSVSRYSQYNTGIGGFPYMVMRNDEGFLWGIMSGTSMAAPTVAGIIAQWLQINPRLTPGEIKNVIAETAIKDMFTQNQHNGVRFGPNGKIDALAGARYILAQMGDSLLQGDVNDDGQVNITDAVMLITYLSEEGGLNEPVINSVQSDMNQDGLINITDALLLITHISLDDGN